MLPINHIVKDYFMITDDQPNPDDSLDSDTTPPNKPDDSPTQPQDPESTVPLKDHRRAMADLKSLKEQNQQLRDQAKERERRTLQEKEDYKSLYEQERSEREELEEKYNNFGSAVTNDKKLTAVREHCIQLGMLESALKDLDILDLTAVEIETTSLGNINVIGAKAFAEELKTTRPHWFGKRGAKVNTDLPLENGGGGQVTFKQLEKLAEAARKSGDYSAYQKAHAKYRAQLNRV